MGESCCRVSVPSHRRTLTQADPDCETLGHLNVLVSLVVHFFQQRDLEAGYSSSEDDGDDHQDGDDGAEDAVAGSGAMGTQEDVEMGAEAAAPAATHGGDDGDEDASL